MTTQSAAALAVKRGIDLMGAAALLVVLSPVLAWTALAALVTQGSPILFRQERPGFHGKPFTLFKFRTMRAPRRGEVSYLADNQRLTRLGRFLRSTSIDELPELVSVLRGDMSLVGPRPLLAEYLDQYTPEEQRRHDMRPGISGWAAVNGRHALRFDERFKLDVWYVDHWSLLLDFKIMARTVMQVLRRQDVSPEACTADELMKLGVPLPGVRAVRLEGTDADEGANTATAGGAAGASGSGEGESGADAS